MKEHKIEPSYVTNFEKIYRELPEEK